MEDSKNESCCVHVLVVIVGPLVSIAVQLAIPTDQLFLPIEMQICWDTPTSCIVVFRDLLDEVRIRIKQHQLDMLIFVYRLVYV